jgi:acetolactate synthase II small subunit
MTTQHSLEITADNQPTVLERLLQVTRYRGFSVTAFSVYPNQDESALTIKLTVSDNGANQGNVGRLALQLDKLFDIQHVNLAQAVNAQYIG